VSKIDHIGIAVNSLATAIPTYAALLGENPTSRESVPSEGVRVAIFQAGETRIELLEALGPDTVVGRFLASRGAGIHHIALRVHSLATVISRILEDGGEVISPGIRTGSGSARVAFLHPRTTGGVLVELVERAE